MKETHLFLSTDVKGLPMQEVRVMGQKLAGPLLQDEAELLE